MAGRYSYRAGREDYDGCWQPRRRRLQDRLGERHFAASGLRYFDKVGQRREYYLAGVVLVVLR